MKIRYGDLTWQEFRHLKVTDVLLPIGSMEQHGPHLPLATDTIIASEIAHRISNRLKMRIFPPVPVGFSPEHMGFDGTISVKAKNLSAFLMDVFDGFSKSGVEKVFVINGHGGNRALLETLIQSAKEDFDIEGYAFTILDVIRVGIQEMKIPDIGVAHADEVETSLMLAIQPSLVSMGKAIAEKPKLAGGLSFRSRDMHSVAFAWKSTEITKSGVLGDPRSASKEKGEKLLSYTVEKISEIIRKVR